jgi:archaellin
MIPAGAQVGSYDTFTVQINPPTGASITLQRTLPPIAAVMTLN